MRKQLSILVLLIIYLAMTGCAPAAEFPTGECLMNYDGTGHGIASGHGAVYKFYEDGTFTVIDSGVERISGTYTVDGDKYTELSGLKACDPEGPATYKWTFNGQTLTFMGIGKDTCEYRFELYEDRTCTFQE